MKIRFFTNLITMITALFIIWCVTPPEYPLIVKVLLSILVICLCSVLRLGKIIGKRVLRLLRTGYYLVGGVLTRVDDALYDFTEWFCKVNLASLRAKSTRVVEDSKQAFGAIDKKTSRPVRRIARWCDATAFCGCVSICTAGGFLLHYHDPFPFIFLCAIAWYLSDILWHIAANCTSAAHDDAMIRSTDPALGIFALMVQWVVPLLQGFFAVIVTCHHDEIPTHPIWEPFFTARVGSWSYSVSPIIAIIFVSAILSLFCCGNLCAAIQDLANLPLDEEAES